MAAQCGFGRPGWNEVANRLTGLTWLGEYPQVFAAMQTEENPDDQDFFQGVHFVNLDGKVFPCDKSRLHNVIKRALYSSKTKKTGMQALVWSMPCGTPILVRAAIYVQQMSRSSRCPTHFLRCCTYFARTVVLHQHCVVRVWLNRLNGECVRACTSVKLLSWWCVAVVPGRATVHETVHLMNSTDWLMSAMRWGKRTGCAADYKMLGIVRSHLRVFALLHLRWSAVVMRLRCCCRCDCGRCRRGR